MTKIPVINQRYESQEQLRRFKRAAKVYHWSLNTFMNRAGEELAEKVFAEVRQSQQQEKQERINQEIRVAIGKQLLQEGANAENSESNRSTSQPSTHL
jgi:uncharacterized protein (DUF1778 family)